jgi:hypothetical protein
VAKAGSLSPMPQIVKIFERSHAGQFREVEKEAVWGGRRNEGKRMGSLLSAEFMLPSSPKRDQAAVLEVTAKALGGGDANGHSKAVLVRASRYRR